LIEGDEFAALVADIEANGLRDRITLHEGKILDGRNRYRAAHEADVPLSRNDVRIFVGGDSVNLRRRYLDPSQRAMIAAKLANLPRGVRSDRAASLPVLSITEAAAAEMLGVSEQSVRDAHAVLDPGSPDAVRAVKVGETPVSRAVESVKPLGWQHREDRERVFKELI
jgi:ParB-like chromosome segregation protein Spo0J